MELTGIKFMVILSPQWIVGMGQNICLKYVVTLKNIDKSLSSKNVSGISQLRPRARYPLMTVVFCLIMSSVLSSTEALTRSYSSRVLPGCKHLCSFMLPALIINKHTYSTWSRGRKFMLEEDKVLKRLPFHNGIIYLNFKLSIRSMVFFE